MARRRKSPRDRVRAAIAVWADRFERHRLLTYASAIAFDVFKASVALLLLGFGVLGALHERKVWKEEMAPSVKRKVLGPVFQGIDATVDKILSHGSAGLVVFAFLLALWYVSGSVRACMDAMNEIYETEESRPTWLRWAVSLALGLAIEVCIVGAVLLVFLTKQIHGAAAVPVTIGRWLAVVLLIGVAVNLLVRFGPVEPREASWASFGTAVVVLVWLLASVVFALFVSRVASFRTATGSLAVFLVLGGYLYTSAIIFLVGVELDELLRKDATRGEHGILDVLAGRV